MDEMDKLQVTTAVQLLVASVDHTGQPRMTPDEVSDLAAVTIGRAMSAEVTQLRLAAATGDENALAKAQEHLDAIRAKVAEAQKAEVDLLDKFVPKAH